MQTEGNIVEIQRIPLSSPRFRRQVENFLAANGLRTEVFDDYFSVLDKDGSILAGAGLSGDVIKGVAVGGSARSLGLVAPLVSHIIGFASGKGITNLKVFTKPENEAIFASLGFHTIAQAPLAILMENGHGLYDYLKTLSVGVSCHPERSEGSTGVIIMNANPFTLGHKYLVEKASASVDRLYVVPVKEDVSMFPYEERVEMIRQGCEGLATVLEGSDYQISAATFPTYFLKDLSEASETQMRLDLDLFARRIAPALSVTVRFVGSEPSDPLTARYNELMKEILPARGITVVEIPRFSLDENAISATEVRKALSEVSFQSAAALTPPTTWPYLVTELMARALKMELDAPLKPGLVDPDSSGAHSDMDYALMLGSVKTIRRSFIRHLESSLRHSTRMEGLSDNLNLDLVAFGKAIERDVMEYTGGVNTYRGAIFALGLAAIAALEIARDSQLSEYQGNRFTATELSDRIAGLSGLIAAGNGSHGARAVKEYGVKGALQMAREGYKPLFEDWLSFYQGFAAAGSPRTPYASRPIQVNVRPGTSRPPHTEPWTLQRTLLRVMSGLDDTCVIHRVGYKRAQEVKEEAKALLENFSEDGLKEMKKRYDAEGISPGGAADMLALTILIDSLTN